MISNEEFKEVLGELVNISFGHATATIADLFDNFATLHVPNVEVIPLQDINTYLAKQFNEKEIYITTQHFRGEFQGEISLTIEPESASKMNIVVGGNDNTEENEIKHNLLEIANILGVTCLSQLADMLETQTSFSPPSIEMRKQLIENVDDSPYSNVIIISTVLSFEELNIMGNLFILCNDAVLSWLVKAVEEFMENNL